MLGEQIENILEKCQKDKDLTQAQIKKYNDTFPNVCNEEYQKSVNVRSIVVVGILAIIS